MTATQMPRGHRVRRAPRSAATAAVALLLTAALTAPVAHADPPGVTEDSSPPVHIDTGDPDLRMVQGAKLAPSKVLNIKSIVEADDGSERRQDTNDNVTFALRAEVLFGKDSAELSSDALSRIGTIAAEIKKQNATSLRVFGFTDNLGSAGHGLGAVQEARHRRPAGTGQGPRLVRQFPDPRLRRAVPDRRQRHRGRPQEEPPGRGQLPARLVVT